MKLFLITIVGIPFLMLVVIFVVLFHLVELILPKSVIDALVGKE